MFGWLFNRECGHNPTGIWPGIPEWEGECPDETCTAERARFKSPTWGYRAPACWLIIVADRPGANTLRGLLAQWRGATCKKDHDGFLQKMAEAMGLVADEVFQPKRYLDAFRFLRAMTIIEQGGTLGEFKTWQINEGMRRAGISDVPPTPFHRRLEFISGAMISVGSLAALLGPWLSGYSDKIDGLKSQKAVVAYQVVMMICGAVSMIGSWVASRRQRGR